MARAEVARHGQGRRADRRALRRGGRRARPRSRRAGATPRATRARSRRSRRCTGEDVSWLPGCGRGGARRPTLPEVGEQERFLVAGAGRDWPTAQEAVLKLREGAWVAAEAYETEQLLHGYLAAVDESVRAFVLEGEGRSGGAGGRRGRRAAGARLRRDLVPTRHPVVDVVMFQRLAVAHRRRARPRAGPDPPRRRALGRGGSAVAQPVDEAERLPALVDRRALVVDEAVREADLLHRVEVEVGVELRRLLRPRDPEPVGRRERRLQRARTAARARRAAS